MESQADQGLNVRLCVENIFFIINIGIIFPQGHSFSILLVLDLVPNVAGNVVTARLKLPLNREDLIWRASFLFGSFLIGTPTLEIFLDHRTLIDINVIGSVLILLNPGRNVHILLTPNFLGRVTPWPQIATFNTVLQHLASHTLYFRLCLWFAHGFVVFLHEFVKTRVEVLLHLLPYRLITVFGLNATPRQNQHQDQFQEHWLHFHGSVPGIHSFPLLIIHALVLSWPWLVP